VYYTRAKVTAVVEEHVGGQRRRLTGSRPQQVQKKVASSTLRRFPTEVGGSGSWLAWLRGTRGRCSVVGTQRLERRSAARGKAEVGRSLAAAEEEEGNGVPAWPLRGTRVRHARGGGDCMGCTWSGGGGRSTVLARGGVR
jgi:hypothetical protein